MYMLEVGLGSLESELWDFGYTELGLEDRVPSFGWAHPLVLETFNSWERKLRQRRFIM